MKVSIIIPIYNVADHVEACLLSVLNQSYKNIEIILVDDAGNDNSMEVVQKTINNHTHPSIKIIHHQRNLGLSTARNTGILAATGEYLYFLDSDDQITLDCIKLLANAAIEQCPNFVIGNYDTIGSSLPYPPLKLKQGIINTNEEILKSYLDGAWYMMAWNKLVHRGFLIKNSLYFKEGLIHEDNLWSFQLACKADKMYIVKNKTYLYHIRKNSITQNLSIENFNSYLDIIKEIVSDIKKDHQLKNNHLIYRFIENLKEAFFTTIYNSDQPFSFKYSAYKSIRKSQYEFPILSLIKRRVNSKLLKASAHYFTPSAIGYKIYGHYVSSTDNDK